MSQQPVARFLDRSTPPHIITLILLAGVSALSMNVFLPSLPNMAAYFRADYALMQLSVAVYLGFNAFLQIILGPLSDRYGRRPVVLAGFTIFGLASIGCALAPTVEVFLTFRMIQSAVVVGMILSRAIVRDMYPRDKAASMIGWVTMGMTLVPMFGPVLGGFLDEIFGWQANFWILTICGVLTVFVVWNDLGETATHRSSSFAEQFRQYPELISSRRFWGYCLTAAFGGGAFFAYLGGGPFVGSNVYGLSPSRLGIFFGIAALGYLLGNFCSGRFSVRFGVDRMILTGAVLLAASLFAVFVLFFIGLGSYQLFFGSMLLVGIGNGMVLPNANAGMLSVRPHLAGSAAGFGGMIAIGIGAALSGFAGSIVTVETGALPLIILMLATSLLSLLSITLVIRRNSNLDVAEHDS